MTTDRPASKKRIICFKLFNTLLFGFGLAVYLPYGWSLLISFWALSNLIFDRREQHLISDEQAGWIEICIFACLPTAIFILYEALPLRIDDVFTVDAADGSIELFPSILFLVLYGAPILWRLRYRQNALSCLGFQLNFRHVLLLLLTLIPFLVFNIRFAGPYADKFRLIPDGTLLIAAIKPFYYNGLWEEIYFRGLLFSLLLTRLPVGSAIVLSALVFTFSHYDLLRSAGSLDFAYIIGQLSAVYAMGLVLAYVFWRTCSIWPGVLFHSLSSGSAYLAAYLARNW